MLQAVVTRGVSKCSNPARWCREQAAAEPWHGLVMELSVAGGAGTLELI